MDADSATHPHDAPQQGVQPVPLVPRSSRTNVLQLLQQQQDAGVLATGCVAGADDAQDVAQKAQRVVDGLLVHTGHEPPAQRPTGAVVLDGSFSV
jgi:hypothetical protein